MRILKLHLWMVIQKYVVLLIYQKLQWYVVYLISISFIVGCLYSSDALLPSGSGPLNYKFVIDNVDKNVKLSFQRDEIQGHSYHCVHGYCVQDRVDTSMLSDREPQFRKADPVIMVPSQTDIDHVKDEMVTFVTRYVVVVQRLRIVNFVCRIIVQHFDQYIPSKYSTEMGTKIKNGLYNIILLLLLSIVFTTWHTVT